MSRNGGELLILGQHAKHAKHSLVDERISARDDVTRLSQPVLIDYALESRVTFCDSHIQK